jgi:hypothetical protein
VETIKEFHLVRIEDIHGKSGTGIVARGVVLPSGAVCMEWQTFHSSICIYKNIQDVEEIHGHGGATIVVMGPPPSTTEKPKRGRKRKDEVNTNK